MARKLLSPQTYRLYAVYLAAISLVPCWMVWLFANGAIDGYRHRKAYEDRAVIATATITGFKSSTNLVGKKTVTSTQPLIEFPVDGRMARTTLGWAPEVPVSEQPAWIGRQVAIRHLPEQPDSAIAADAVPRLPGAGFMLSLMAVSLALLAFCWYCVAVTWRASTRR